MEDLIPNYSESCDNCDTYRGGMHSALCSKLQRLEAERAELKAALTKIRDATGAIPKDWQKFALLELNGRIFDAAHSALQD